MNIERIRNVLNILFMIGAAASVVLFFTASESNPFLYIYVCMVAIVIKMVEYVLRISQKTKDKNKRKML